MKTPMLKVVALLVGSLLAGGGAQATTFAPLTLVQQAKKADVIVQATIGIPMGVTENNQVYVVYPLKVSETLAGDASTLPQTVGSQGGSGPALFVLSGVESAPVFQVGQEVVLLLYKGRLDSPIVGYNQGAYLIANGQVSVLSAPLATTPGSGAGSQQTQASALPVAPVVPVNTSPAPVPVSPPSAGPAPEPPTPLVTLMPDPLVPVVSAPSPAGSSGAMPTVPAGGGGTQPVSSAPPGTAPALTVPVSATAPPLSLPVPVATGVLGTIRTSADLKAAIVAARASR